MPAPAPWLSLGPVSTERPAAGWTALGALDPSATARVDAAGLVDVPPAGWSLDWWVGADDRWHLPAREPAVRQRRIGSGPVIETALRIPSGDAVHRAWVTRHGGREVLVVEVENASPAPVALAFGVRPYDVTGEGRIERFDRDDRTVWVDGRPALWLARPANQAAVAVGRDLVDAIQAGSELTWDGPGTDPGGRVVGLVVYPLPHRARIRVAMPVADWSSGPVDPADLPDHETVARGWDAVVDAGARITLPDPGLSERAGRFRARLLLDAPALPDQVVRPEPGAVLRMAALAASGSAAEATAAATALSQAWEDDPAPRLASVEAVGALALTAGLADDRSLEPALTPTLVGLTRQLDRWRARKAARPALAALAAHTRRIGQDDAAQLLCQRAGSAGSDAWAWLPAPTVDHPGQELSEVSATGAFPDDDPTAAARAWLGIRRLVVEDGGDGLELFRSFPSSWRGGPAEVHRLATLHGRLSCAIRWHGYRPALLWELERRAGDPVVPLSCPGLDPTWSSTEASGEVLLAGSAEGLAPAPVEGDSFS